MLRSFTPRTTAILQAAFVTFLWSTSWVLIKFGLRDNIPPLTFAGLRYTLAFLCLMPLVFRKPEYVSAVRHLKRETWLKLIVLGLLGYTVNQSAQFIGLKLLPTIAVNLLLSFTAVAVALLSLFMTHEKPGRAQWLGVGIYLVGVAVYFFPITLPETGLQGVIVVLVGMLAAALASLLGRSLNRSGVLDPIPMTATSMGIGAIVMLAAGLATEGLPRISPSGWLIIGWLALVNTAFAFTLWNHTLRTLSALESSILNNLMLAQIPLLAWVFLGETISLKAAVGLVFAGIGIAAVQIRFKGRQPKDAPVIPELIES